MSFPVYQYCYANSVKKNASGNIVTGWGPVVTSDALPLEAAKFCEKMMNANASYVGKAKDSEGNDLNILELRIDEKYLYLTRSRYYQLDVISGSDRGNMFGHCYVLPLLKENFTSLRELLRIADDSFKINIPSAKEQVSKEPVLYKPFTLTKAMEVCGLDKESYKSLMYSVYSCASLDAQLPLYICYDGSAQQMRAAIYCIFCGLPFFVSRHLSVASAFIKNKPESSIMFTSSRDISGKRYFDLATGENNVLDDSLRHQLKAKEFFEAAFSKDIFTEDDLYAYFKLLDDTMLELGYKQKKGEGIAVVERYANNAYFRINGSDISQFSETELVLRLSQSVNSMDFSDNRMATDIADLLREVHSREITLLQAMEEKLALWYEQSSVDALKFEYEQYRLFIFDRLDEQAAVEELNKVPSNLFGMYRKRLIQLEKYNILDLYYQNRVKAAADSFVALKNIYTEFSEWPGMTKSIAMVKNCACNLFEVNLGATNPLEALDSCLSIFESNSSIQKEIKERLKDIYWKQQQFSNFDPGKNKEYQAMAMKNCPNSEIMLTLDNYYKKLKSCSEEKVYSEIYNCFSDLRKRLSPDSLDEKTVKQLLNKLYPKRNTPLMLCAFVSSNCVLPWLEYLNDIVTTYKKSGKFYRENEKDINFIQYINAFSETEKGVAGKLLDYIIGAFVKNIGHEDKNEYIPLDVWLALGEKLYGNPFEIFDRFKDREPKVFGIDPKDVIEESVLFSDYCNDAIKYCKSCKSKGRKHSINGWINAYKKAPKNASEKKKEENKKNTKTANKNNNNNKTENGGIHMTMRNLKSGPKSEQQSEPELDQGWEQEPEQQPEPELEQEQEPKDKVQGNRKSFFQRLFQKKRR